MKSANEIYFWLKKHWKGAIRRVYQANRFFPKRVIFPVCISECGMPFIGTSMTMQHIK